MSEANSNTIKLDWFPLYFQRLKGSPAWKLKDYQFAWYMKLLIESADSPIPGYLPGSLDKLWQIAGAKSQPYFEKFGGCELVSKLFRRTEISGQVWIYNERMLQVIHQQSQKLSHSHRKRTVSLSLSLQELPSYIPEEVFQEYVNMREKKKKPLTPYAMKLTLAKLGRLHDQGQNVKDILEAAITNCWTGVWPIEQVTNGKHNGNDVVRPAAAKSLTDPDCKICNGTGWDFVDHKAFECECRKRNKANAASAGTVNGGSAERKMPDAAKPSERVAIAGNDGRRV